MPAEYVLSFAPLAYKNSVVSRSWVPRTMESSISSRPSLPSTRSCTGVQLHLSDQVALGLVGWHKGAGPGRRVLNRWTRKRNAGGVGIADGVGNPGVRHTSHNVRLGVVSACQQLAAVVTHFFHADPLIGRGRIAVIQPIGRCKFSFFCPVQPTAAHHPALAPRSRRGQVLCHQYSPSSNRQSFQSWRSNHPAFCPAQWVCAPKLVPGSIHPFGGQKQAYS